MFCLRPRFPVELSWSGIADSISNALFALAAMGHQGTYPFLDFEQFFFQFTLTLDKSDSDFFETFYTVCVINWCSLVVATWTVEHILCHFRATNYFHLCWVLCTRREKSWLRHCHRILPEHLFWRIKSPLRCGRNYCMQFLCNNCTIILDVVLCATYCCDYFGARRLSGTKKIAGNNCRHDGMAAIIAACCIQ